jgi:hypothetical protein
MNVFHGLPGSLHGVQCLLVDICGFDAIYLLLDLAYLVICLL